MQTPARSVLLLLLPSMIGSGCGDVALEGVTLLTDARRPIIHGDDPLKPTDDAVGALLRSYPGGVLPFCSGTLIAPRTFLTAGHCVDDGFGPGDYVFFGDHLRGPLTDFGTLVDVVAVQAHPNYDADTLARDIALVELADDPPGIDPIPPLPPELGMGRADRGTGVRLAGFGRTEATFVDSGLPLMEPKVQTTVRVISVCPLSGPCDWGLMAGTFKYEHGETGACNGDSGGPAFQQRDGTTYVAGVNSSIGAPLLPDGRADCMNAWEGTETLVSDYFDFIEDFMEQHNLSTNACADAPCDPVAGCTNLPMTHRCGDCPAGYEDVHGDGSECRDIDECDRGLDDCAADLVCTNTPGSFECGACPAGYEDVNGDGSECVDNTSFTNQGGAQSESVGHVSPAHPGPLTNVTSCAALTPPCSLALLGCLALARRRARRKDAQ